MPISGIQVAPDARASRSDPGRVLELRNGLGELSPPGQHAPEVLERVDIVRSAAQRSPIVRDRALGIARAQPDVPEVVVGRGVLGIISSAAW